MIKNYLFFLLLFLSLILSAQAPKTVYMPSIEGTVRAKYEYDTERHASRFQVRNARFSVNGLINPYAYYKAEIDLSDKGTTKMLDAYVQLRPYDNLNFTIGQQRIPFGKDVLRSPHMLLFANRSFIAKQMSNGLRDVGAMILYKNKALFPMELKAGIYNGKGINFQDTWEKDLSLLFSTGFKPINEIELNLAYFSFSLPDLRVNMYNSSICFKTNLWHLEAEYTHRAYSNKSIKPTHALSAFIAYNIILKESIFSKISPLIRFDRMTDSTEGKYKEPGKLIITEPTRSRVTGGFTFSLDKPFLNDIRLNYEQYFYSNKPDKTNNKIDLSKLVLEFVIRF